MSLAPVPTPSSLLQQLFPDTVVTRKLRTPADVRLLHPEEEPFVARAVEKRRAEFATGRHCARHALAALGLPETALPVGEKRAPVWPAAAVGSITHADEYVAAVVALRRDAATLGVDIEARGRVEPRLWSHLFTQTEQSWLRRQAGDQRDTLATVMFSAKESFYKCQFQLTHAWVGFLDAEVRLEDDRFELELLTPPDALTGWTPTWRGRFSFDDRFVATGMILATP